MSFLDIVTDCSLSVLAQVVQLCWSSKLDENQTLVLGIIMFVFFTGSCICLFEMTKHVYYGLFWFLLQNYLFFVRPKLICFLCINIIIFKAFSHLIFECL